MDRTAAEASLPRLLSYVGAWATTEIIRGLLLNNRTYELLGAGATIKELTGETGLSERQATALLEALRVEDLVEREDDRYGLTAFGRDLWDLRGWFELIVNGYRDIFANADSLWRGHVESQWRNMEAVGTSSTRMSAYGAVPLVSRLISTFRPDVQTIADIGCGDGSSLIQLCRDFPHARGIAVEPIAELAVAAETVVAHAGLSDRITVVNEPAQVFPDHPDVDVAVIAFVLHELVGQLGEDETTAFLRSLGSRYPDALTIVIEVDHGWPDDANEMRDSPYSRGYYVPYFVVHEYTDQQLMPFPAWRDLFRRAGFELIHEEPIDPAFDPTGRECAFVLRFAG